MANRADRRRATRESRVELRAQVLALRTEGKTYQEISDITGYVRPYCVKLVQELGETPERARTLSAGGRPKGNGRTLTPKQETQLLRWIVGRCPDQLLLPFVLWTRRAVQELIRVKLGIRMPIRTVGLYLQRWGLTPQRPTRRAYERDDAAVERWLRVEYPKIQRRAAAERAEINWGDETGLRSDESRHRGYAPPASTPIVRIPARRSSLSVISSITNRGDLRFMIYKGALTPARFITFMRRLIKGRRKKIFLIVDNLSVHKARKVTEWVGRHSEEIELFHLPPYSPELNPDEYLNSDLKRAVHSDVPPRDAPALMRLTLSHLRRIQARPRRIAGYFRHPQIRYAA